MPDQLSGVAVIICIAFGVMTFILLFIFAKRQITRFKLKSRRGPHLPIGQDAPRNLRKEIQRKLDIIQNMQSKPKLLNDNFKYLENNQSLNYIHRMKVVDILNSLRSDLMSIDSPRRLPNQDMRSYFLSLVHSGSLKGCDQQLVDSLIDLYEHARHKPEEFNYEHYLNFIELLESIYKSISDHYESHKIETSRLQVFTAHIRSSVDTNVELKDKQMLILQRPISLNIKKNDELIYETAV